jgi:Family of unknown function (DUF5808)
MSTRKRKQVGGIVLGGGLLAAAIATELRKPSRNRTWHGRLLGFVPYDLRPPTFRRVKSRWWNPSDPRLLTPRAFGVGWDINFGRLVGR